MSVEITKNQLNLLQAIEVLHTAKGYPPTVRELCAFMSYGSTNAVQERLDRCIKLGLLSREPRLARSLKITAAGRDALKDVDENADD